MPRKKPEDTAPQDEPITVPTAVAARALLNNPFLADLFIQLECDIKDSWEAAQSTERREGHHADLRALRKLQITLKDRAKAAAQ